MGGLLTGWHFWVILLVVLLLFGAPKLPGLAKSLGQSLRVFRKEVKGLRDDSAADAEPSKDAANASDAPTTPGASDSSKQA